MPYRLKNSKSPYLRSVADEPVEWYEWSEEAFIGAKREDKPILLSIGASWCHWCHVMSHECFRNPEISEIINENFIPIKVDRDERPDIDRRYQEAVTLISGSSGWPLTAFLTPDGKAFFGGTYFPPDERYGRVGFKSILKRVIEVYRNEKDRIIEASNELFDKIAFHERTEIDSLPSEEFIINKAKEILSLIDMRHGGFGTKVKFYFSPTIEFLLDMYIIEPSESMRIALMTTLDSIAMGGVYDHILGGFFRYSTDDRWLIPHFEKMLYDNALLLRLYTKAWRRFKKELYLDIINGIIRYYKEYGSHGDGGFYASQDADIGHLDEGGYYIFSYDEVKDILTQEEFNIIRLHFDIDEEGEMEGKNILHIAKTPEQISLIHGIPIDRVKELIRSAKEKMLSYRNRRELPFIDKTLYTDLNGMMIESLSIAGRLLKKRDLISMAERSAKRILKENYKEERLFHSEGIKGFSDDYIFLAMGLLELFQVTGKDEYIRESIKLTDMAIDLFSDNGGLLFDTEEIKDEGYLRIRKKTIQDNPNESPNGVAPCLMMCLYNLTDNKKYMDVAMNIMKESIPYIEAYPVYTGSLMRSLLSYYRGIRKVETKDYLEDALHDLYPFNLVVRKEVDGSIVCHKDRCERFSDYPFFFQ